MPIQNVRIETAFHVSHRDVEKAINAFYGVKDFSVVASAEATNGSVITVNTVPAVMSYDLDLIALVRAGKTPSFAVNAILQDMCFHGDIPPGTYYIHVGW